MHRIISTYIICLITVILVGTGFYINTNSAQRVRELIEQSAEYSFEKNNADADETMDKAMDIWKSKSQLMLLFMPHDRVDQINETLNIAQEYLRSDNNEMFRTECKRAVILLQKLNNLEYPTINNIM